MHASLTMMIRIGDRQHAYVALTRMFAGQLGVVVPHRSYAAVHQVGKEYGG